MSVSEESSTTAQASRDAAHDAASPAPAPRSPAGPAREWIRSFLIAFGLFLLIRTFLVEAFRIPTGSMENTLLAGDFLLVNKAVFGARPSWLPLRTPALAAPQRGDIVVFSPPHEPDRNYVKRVVGVAGDTLEMRSGRLLVNGRLQVESFTRQPAGRDTYASDMYWQCEHMPASFSIDDCRPTRDNWGPLIVPDARFFLLGDNRGDSEDSRFWGFVHREAIRGRPLFVYFSFDPAAQTAVPWLTDIRWGRVGAAIH